MALKESYEKLGEDLRARVNKIQSSSNFKREEPEEYDEESERRPARRGRDNATGGGRQRQDGNNERGRRGRRSLERTDGDEETKGN